MANIMLVPVPCFQPIPVFGPAAHFHGDISHPIPILPEPVQGARTLSEGVLFEMYTLPVKANSVPDGDGINVYVGVTDSWEVPEEVSLAVDERSRARCRRNFGKADEIRRQVNEMGYHFVHYGNEEILARRYRLRLRGIDAPENAMPYGKEAKDELIRLVVGKQLRVLVYDIDHYGRYVADVYCEDDVFVQEILLRKGFAWHYATYDHRLEFALWEQEARANQMGLWASPNPEKPWAWRKDRREGR